MKFKLSFFICLVDVLLFALIVISTNMSWMHDYELLNYMKDIWVNMHWPMSVLAKHVINAGYNSNSYEISLFFYINGYNMLFIQTFCIVFFVDNVLFKIK